MSTSNIEKNPFNIGNNDFSDDQINHFIMSSKEGSFIADDNTNIKLGYSGIDNGAIKNDKAKKSTVKEEIKNRPSLQKGKVYAQVNMPKSTKNESKKQFNLN